METLQINFSSKKEPGSRNIIDRVKTFEDACDILGITPDNPVSISYPQEYASDVKSVNAYIKLIIIGRALNEGWKPNWSNSSEYKYYPWFDMSSGSGLSLDGVGAQDSDSGVGSRLCFKSRALAEYAVKQFSQLYHDFFII